MCIRPNTLADGTQVACRECWQCLENKINDKVGRNIAESKTATKSHYVTLTYGRVDNEVHHPRSLWLTYSDIQKTLKLLRFHGYDVRYMVAGEKGSKYERAHWHAILHWQCDPPPGIKMETDRWMWERIDPKTGLQATDDKGEPAYWWSHGFCYFRDVSPENIRYCCAYVQRDMLDDAAQAELHYSLKPPLGDEWFRQLAERHVLQGVAPQHLFYRFPDVTKAKRGAKSVDEREVVEFMLTGRMAEVYVQHFVDAWHEWNGDRKIPSSELVETWLDYGKLRAPNTMKERPAFESDLRAKAKLPDIPMPPMGKGINRWWMTRRNIKWNTQLRCWEAPDHPDIGGTLYYRWIPKKGAYGWRPLLGARHGKK